LFRGSYEYTVDERGRVPLPRQYRERLGGDAVMVVDGNEGCLEIYSMREYDARAAAIERQPDTTENGRRLRRAFYGNAREVPIDKQTRILVPAPMREAAEIEGAVVIVGRGTVLELWNRQRWENENTIVKERYSEALEQLFERPT
jgi:transcriptional regulator MraZ